MIPASRLIAFGIQMDPVNCEPLLDHLNRKQLDRVGAIEVNKRRVPMLKAACKVDFGVGAARFAFNLTFPQAGFGLPVFSIGDGAEQNEANLAFNSLFSSAVNGILSDQLQQAHRDTRPHPPVRQTIRYSHT